MSAGSDTGLPAPVALPQPGPGARPDRRSRRKTWRSPGLTRGNAARRGVVRALAAWPGLRRGPPQPFAPPAKIAAMNPTDRPDLRHTAFYRFTPVADPSAFAESLKALGAGLHGSILVAPEGLNGAVSGDAEAVRAFETALQQPGVLGGALAGMAFKRSGCVTEPFGKLKVVVKPEIVALALPGAEALPMPDERDATHVSPRAWRELLDRDDVVLLDNRNHFEYRLGHFRGAADPEVRRFSDLVSFVQAHAPAWRAEGRPVAMYCTGGIRCDKTAPWLRSLGLEVMQLEGGILNYFQQMDDAERDWLGECFVFDKRIALDTRLAETPTAAEQVYDAADPGEAWRLERALRLDRF